MERFEIGKTTLICLEVTPRLLVLALEGGTIVDPNAGDVTVVMATTTTTTSQSPRCLPIALTTSDRQ